MKYIQLNDYGTPHKVCSVETGSPPPPPGDGEVTVRMLACPINPAELLIFAGRYASKPDLPYRPGIEGVGDIAAVGPNVDGLAVGDRVISLGRQNWAQQVNLAQTSVIAVPADADLLQLGMLKINPATAWLMLKRFVELQPGDWLIQNAANSGVGHAIIQLAAKQGYRTINVVRRPWLVDDLKSKGADVVLVDDETLGERARAEIGEGKVKLAIDAVAGDSTLRVASALDDDGVVVNYGLLSGNPCQIDPSQLVFKGLSLRGFWLAKLMGGMKLEELSSMYQSLAANIADGTLHTPVEQTYPLDAIEDALEHANREARSGKILLTPNPDALS